MRSGLILKYSPSSQFWTYLLPAHANKKGKEKPNINKDKKIQGYYRVISKTLLLCLHFSLCVHLCLTHTYILWLCFTHTYQHFVVLIYDSLLYTLFTQTHKSSTYSLFLHTDTLVHAPPRVSPRTTTVWCLANPWSSSPPYPPFVVPAWFPRRSTRHWLVDRRVVGFESKGVSVRPWFGFRTEMGFSRDFRVEWPVGRLRSTLVLFVVYHGEARKLHLGLVRRGRWEL